MKCNWVTFAHLWTVFLCTCLAISYAKLRGKDIILQNEPVDGLVGRTVPVNPLDNLRIRVRDGDTCLITVIDNKLDLTYRPGSLSKTRFPCNFGPDDVKYVHYGGRKFVEDKIQMLLRYETARDSIIIPFSLEIKIHTVLNEIVTTNNAIIMSDQLDYSSPIDSYTLQFSYDRDSYVCKVSVISPSSALPQYGYLLNNSNTLTNVDCDTFLMLGVRYKQHSQSNKLQYDFIPLHVKLLSRTGELASEEYVQIEVFSSSGRENTPPEPSPDASFLMGSINQFVMTAITPDIVSATDAQTPSDRLLFNITQPLGPGEGIIVNTDNQNVPIASFYQQNINDLKISYIPPSLDSNIKRMFQLWITICDPDGLTSDPIPLMIVVEPMSKYAPVVSTNTGIQLIEGQSMAIVSPNVLQISDADNLEDVRIYHVDGLRNGHLTLPAGKKYFTPHDLRTGKVVYHHDDSDSVSDNIVFVTDGAEAVKFLFPVTIYPKDDQLPTLNVNKVLEVQKHGLIGISTNILSATDIDTDDSELTFNLEAPYSRIGMLVKRQYLLPDDTIDWHFVNGIYEKVVTHFTQQDIVEGKLFYKHDVSSHMIGIVADVIRFYLTDNGTPPNRSPFYELSVRIHPIDDVPPYIYPNTQLQLEVDEIQLTEIRRKSLRYSDDDTNDREIRYVITRQPYDTYSHGSSDAGMIVNCEEPGRPVYRFIQNEVNHHKLCYQPPKAELGITTRIVQFVFTVADQAGNQLENQRFNIILKPIDKRPPMITNAGAVLYENSRIVISTDLLDMTDTDVSSLVMYVRQSPNHGTLYKGGQKLSLGDTFTYANIEQNNIMYQNIAGDTSYADDNFIIDVSDGSHFITVNFKITIKPIEDHPSYLEAKAGSGSLDIELEVQEKQSVQLQPEHFRISDRDNGAMHVTYMIIKSPDFGVVRKNGLPVNYFTQDDVTKGLVEFKHFEKEIGRNKIEDTFQLKLRGNRNIVLADGTALREINIKVNILPVDNLKPGVLVGRDVDVAEGGRTEILPNHIIVTDIDSIEDDILCTIITQPSNGYIENKSPTPGSQQPETGVPISAFTIYDIRLGNILYVQNVHKGIEPRSDQLVFKCSDGRNAAEEATLHIVIQPTNDEEPEVFVREIIGSEGMLMHIDTPILSAIDKDQPPDTLTFIITQKPKHGQILQQTRTGDFTVNTFTLDDIGQSSSILYKHDDSETQSDGFQFILTDGVHNITKSVPIVIFPIDDETPRLTVNNGLEIERLNDRKLITSDMLKADDLDSAVDNITFIVRKEPAFGTLTKKFGIKSSRNLTFGSNFTQHDINSELIEYVYGGSEVRRDLIKFDITDGVNPLLDKYFYISVKGMDVIHAHVVNHGILLPQSGQVVLTTDIVSSPLDTETADENVKYTITKVPQHGYIELTNQRKTPITEFTQFDLVSERVRYIHNGDDEIKMDLFEFEVAGVLGPASRVFRVALTAVDNKMPVLMFTTLRLKEGGNKMLTSFEINAIDTDTADDQIIFTITQVPLHGNLLYNYSRIVSRFSKQDMSRSLISYQHDGTETMSDSFIFTVSDGTHLQFFIPGTNIPTRRPQEMDIEIIPVDNGIPHVSVNKGATSLVILTNGLGFTFTKRHLQCDDKDSAVESLRYVLTVPPKHGYISNTQRGNSAVVMWTQGDIDEQHIEYILNKGENASTDTFLFKVVDEGGNSLENQPFHLHWSWVSFQTNQIRVNETQDVLDVTLQRRGYLGETSIVTIEVTESTASIGKDVSRQFAQQVQFNPGQTEKQWRLPLRDDDMYEKEESLILHLTDPVSAVLEQPAVTTVTILDPEDEATVYFPEVVYRVEEGVATLEVPVQRIGDLSNELQVICYTIEDSATGTHTDHVETFSDFITRPQSHNSLIQFGKGENKKMCRVTVIDDSLFEEEEKFHVGLAQPIGGKLGEARQAEVVIVPDKSDEPLFYFDQSVYHVDESAGTVEVKVWKTGTDLSRPSSVTVRSMATENTPAEAGTDYLPVVRILDFSPGEMTKTLQVTILDDIGHPHLEGPETFQLHLRMPVGGAIGEPRIATVIINDSLSDLPKMEFAAAEYSVLESEGHAVAIVTRSGDISGQSRVVCYTRQATAHVDVDFIERPDNNASFIVFKPDEREAECRVHVIDDSIREYEESFRLVLATADGDMPGGATLGGQFTTKIVVDDPEDSPVIKFERSRYTVNEPIIKGDTNILRVRVVRAGDVSGVSKVTVFTRSDSAMTGRDFTAYNKEFVFSAGQKVKTVKLEILYDEDREYSESFSLNLKPDSSLNNTQQQALQHNQRTLIYIEENSKLANVVFPEVPMVISLRDYDMVAEGLDERPIQGFPLVCVSPCNPKHPKYPVVRRMCIDFGIDDSLTKFRWRVGPPSDRSGMPTRLRDVEMNTVFTNTRHVTLDSIYFTAGSRVQCYARAVNDDREPGKEKGSAVITVDRKQGLCRPRTHNSFTSDPYTARLRYTGPDDVDHPNTVRLTVQIPHQDGLLPVVSTNLLSNFKYTLSDLGFRGGQHRCSNLVDISEHKKGARFGFLSNTTTQSLYQKEVEPYQHSAELRSNTTLNFYKNLDLESCLWTFDGYFTMSELVSECGGSVQTDAQVVNSKQSYVSLRVPLFVSYLYYTSGSAAGWQNNDQNTYLNLKYVYSTDTLWQEGIQSDPHVSNIQGTLYPTHMSVGDNGKLVLAFKTLPTFHGLFLHAHPGVTTNSTVTSLDHRDLGLDLTLTGSQTTFDQPGQMWEVKSRTVLRDYSGRYKISLVPCMATGNQQFSQPIKCTPADPLTFELPIRLQQVSDAVEGLFSLNAKLSVIRKKEAWLTQDLTDVDIEDTAFAPGDTVYGRLDVDPVQSLGNQHTLRIQQVFLCCGKDGFIPRYEPTIGHYGCARATNLLDTVIRMVDVVSPESVDEMYNGVGLKAMVARDDTRASDLHSMTGADGFSFDSSALFQVNMGKKWFIHAIYTIHTPGSDKHTTSRRSLFHHHYREPRALNDVSGIGNGVKGTNLSPLVLDFYGKSITEENREEKRRERDEGQIPLVAAVIGGAVFILIAIFILVIFIRHRRKRASPPPTPSGTITVMSTSTGQTRVISNAHIFKTVDHSEV